MFIPKFTKTLDIKNQNSMYLYTIQKTTPIVNISQLECSILNRCFPALESEPINITVKNYNYNSISYKKIHTKKCSIAKRTKYTQSQNVTKHTHKKKIQQTQETNIPGSVGVLVDASVCPNPCVVEVSVVLVETSSVEETTSDDSSVVEVSVGFFVVETSVDSIVIVYYINHYIMYGNAILIILMHTRFILLYFNLRFKTYENMCIPGQSVTASQLF